MKKDFQIDRIEKWLLRGRKLTPIQALEKFGCFRLGARIHELNKWYQGSIKKKMIKVATRSGWTRVAQYYLEE